MIDENIPLSETCSSIDLCTVPTVGVGTYHTVINAVSYEICGTNSTHGFISSCNLTRAAHTSIDVVHIFREVVLGHEWSSCLHAILNCTHLYPPSHLWSFASICPHFGCLDLPVLVWTHVGWPALIWAWYLLVLIIQAQSTHVCLVLPSTHHSSSCGLGAPRCSLFMFLGTCHSGAHHLCPLVFIVCALWCSLSVLPCQLVSK